MKLTLPAMVVLLVTSPALLADITRSCSADVYVGINGTSSIASIGSIAGRGSCKNKSKANECRAVAREQIDRCVDGMWRDRQKNALAPECTSLSAGSGRDGAKLAWEVAYPIAEPARLTARMAYQTCCKLRPDAGKIKVHISGNITGDKNCGTEKVGNDQYRSHFELQTYDMNCDAWRAQGICSG